MALVFGDFDASGFWQHSEQSELEYVEPFPTGEVVASVERHLGYRLPRSYVELMRTQNGGFLKNTFYQSTDGVCLIEGIKGIGRLKIRSLCSETGTLDFLDDWQYPPIGIYFGDCLSGPHEMIALDYRQCGADGEPTVVHVDQERGFRITPLAPHFEAFVRGLRPLSEFSGER